MIPPIRGGQGRSSHDVAESAAALAVFGLLAVVLLFALAVRALAGGAS